MKRLLGAPLATLCVSALLGSTALVTDGFDPSDMKTFAQTTPTDPMGGTKPADPTLPPSTTPTAPPQMPSDSTMNPDTTSQTQATPPPAGAQATTSFDGRYDFATQTDLFPTGSYSAEELMGLNIKSATGDTVASVSDLVLDRTGMVKKIILSEGGVFGVGSRLVAVAPTAIKPVMQNNVLDHATLEASLMPLANQREFRYEAAASTSAPITGTPSTTPMTQTPSTTGTPSTGTSPMTGTPSTSETPSTTTPSTSTMTTPPASFDTLAMDEFSADRLIDSEIRNNQGQVLATIEDLIITSDNKTADAVLSVGGFLGVSNKHVALDFQDLQLAQGGPTMSQIVLEIPKDQLEAAANVTARANGTWGNL
jgi:sporulation protein YlmC with PRC-barrel domain